MSANASGAQVQRTLHASPERVFAAFADAGLVARWLRPSAEIRLSVLAFDFRVGGAYRFAYDLPNGQLLIRHEKFGRADADLRHAQGWKGALELLEAQLREED